MKAPDFASLLSNLASRREPFVVATVTRTEGSTLAKVGFKIVISQGGDILGGTLGGGCPEGPVVEVAERAMGDGRARVVRIHLVDAATAVAGFVRAAGEEDIYVETDCGGTLEVFIEPMLPTERLVVIGQGGKDDIEEAVVRMGKELGFEVVVVDPMPVLQNAPDMTIESDVVDPEALGIGKKDSVVVLTKGERDAGVLEALSRSKARFVGFLASRSRLQKNLEELRSRGVPEAFLAALHAPVGLDIGAKTPAELALAILGEVVATKYGKYVPHKPAEGRERVAVSRERR